MFKVLKPKDPSFVKDFNTMEQAQDYIARAKKAKGTFVIEEPVAVQPAIVATTRKTIVHNPSSKDWKEKIDFANAVQITRKNVKNFYKKAGYIRVVNGNDDTIHVGRTRNMGKVFSNYANCARYMQSYDFDLDGNDKLYFLEADI